MAIVIKPADAPATVQRVILLLYGQPGVGKTTLACTADDPLLLDFDGGMHRALLRCPRVEVEQWSDVASLNTQDLAPYSTVIIDTFGKAQQMLSQQIATQDRSAVQRNGEMNRQGWGTLRRQFINWVVPITKMGKDVVMLAHSEEFPRGEETVERPMSQGRARNELYQIMDGIGLMNIIAGEIRLNFNPLDGSIGKNAGAIPAQNVPSPENDPNFLGNIIRQMKDNINNRNMLNVSGEQLRELSERLNSINDANGFQAEMLRMKQADSPSRERKMLVTVAKEKGFVLDRSQGIFIVDPERAHHVNGAAAAPAGAPTETAAAPTLAPESAPATAAATPAAAEPVATATAATATATAVAEPPSPADAEREFAPPPSDPVNEPSDPVSDPFANPEDDDKFDF